MCIKAKKNDIIRVAEKNLVVYKVFLSYYKKLVLPFRRVNGIDQYKLTKVSLTHSTINHVVNTRAYGFNYGFGYHSFGSLKQAELYKIKMNHKHKVIVKMIIPKGTVYERGIIQHGYVGSGLRATRSEFLQLPKGEKIKCA
jgi:hypothetical protein